MTYCLATRLEDGIVFLSDKRTNAGVDNVGEHRFDADSPVNEELRDACERSIPRAVASSPTWLRRAGGRER